MRRREFLKLSGLAAITFPSPAVAQKDLPLVAVLVPGTADFAKQRIDAIRKGLREAGLAEGVNYAFALRFALGMTHVATNHQQATFNFQTDPFTPSPSH